MNIPEQHCLLLQQVMNKKMLLVEGKKGIRLFLFKYTLSAYFKLITRRKTHMASCPISYSTVCLSLSVQLCTQQLA